LVCHPKERTQVVGGWERSAEENIWTQRRRSNRRTDTAVLILRNAIIFINRKVCIIRVINEIERYVACMGEMRNVYVILVGKPEGKVPTGRHWRRWEDDINIKEMGWGVNLIRLAKERVR
jgi:hypothetical protein